LVKHYRRRSFARIVADKSLLEKIQVLKAEHPFRGYRRIWAYVGFVAQTSIDKKRVYRLLKENNLLVKRDTRLLARRANHSPVSRARSASISGGALI